MEILNAVDLAGGVHSERDAIKATVTHHTGEATRVVSLPHSPQDSVQDGFRARGTLLQGGLIGKRKEGRTEAAATAREARWPPTHLLCAAPTQDSVGGDRASFGSYPSTVASRQGIKSPHTSFSSRLSHQ